MQVEFQATVKGLKVRRGDGGRVLVDMPLSFSCKPSELAKLAPYVGREVGVVLADPQLEFPFSYEHPAVATAQDVQVTTVPASDDGGSPLAETAPAVPVIKPFPDTVLDGGSPLAETAPAVPVIKPFPDTVLDGGTVDAVEISGPVSIPAPAVVAPTPAAATRTSLVIDQMAEVAVASS